MSLPSNRKTIPSPLRLMPGSAFGGAVYGYLRTNSLPMQTMRVPVLCTLVHLTQQRLFVYDCYADRRLKVE